MVDAINASAYVLLLLPGFIFVQTRDYHLLREAKGQFEKTLEIVLWSAFLWVIICAIPLEWPFLYCRLDTLIELRTAASDRNPNAAPVWLSALTRHAGVFFLLVCLYSFLGASVWGYLRKNRQVEAVVKAFTGRDWYPSVSFRFFNENLDKLVVIEVNENRYCGILFGAPDTKEDKYVLLKRVALLPKEGSGNSVPEPLPLVESMLIKVDEIEQIQALSAKLLRKAKSSYQNWRKTARKVPKQPVNPAVLWTERPILLGALRIPHRGIDNWACPTGCGSFGLA